MSANNTKSSKSVKAAYTRALSDHQLFNDIKYR